MAVKNLRTFVDDVQAGGRLFFSAREIPSAEGSRAVEAALRRLAKNGSIRRLLPKSPAFVIVPPEHRTMGLPPVEWWLDDLMAYLGQDYYLGLLSAAAVAGSSHFPPMETQVVTTKWVRPIETERLRIRFFQKAVIPQNSVSVSQGVWGPLRISSPALTAFDLVLYPVCSPAQTCLLLSDLAATISRTGLMEAVEDRPDVPAAQRLGLLLDRAGASKLAKAVHAWRGRISTDPIDLETNAGPGKMDRRWNVCVNVNLETMA